MIRFAGQTADAKRQKKEGRAQQKKSTSDDDSHDNLDKVTTRYTLLIRVWCFNPKKKTG